MKTVSAILRPLPEPLTTIAHFILGLIHRYPLCCVAQFTLNEWLLGRELSILRWRIARPDGKDGLFTPCRFHAKRDIRTKGIYMYDWQPRLVKGFRCQHGEWINCYCIYAIQDKKRKLFCWQPRNMSKDPNKKATCDGCKLREVPKRIVRAKEMK